MSFVSAHDVQDPQQTLDTRANSTRRLVFDRRIYIDARHGFPGKQCGLDKCPDTKDVQPISLPRKVRFGRRPLHDKSTSANDMVPKILH
jgi:hypothetical protein